jgi:serine/threonine protein kinase/WD40 repeat protein
MPLAPGTQLGPYEISAPLGAGGMGEVYRARDIRLDRTVAIKILPAHLSSDPVRKQRFEREAKTISSLNHPHICVLYDVGSQDGVDYLVMESVEGETLAKRLEKGPLPLEQVLKYGTQIADALDKAHRSGVIHRDLKPGNIMLTPTGAKLLDFGLAKLAVPLTGAATLTAAATQTTPMTQEGAIVGTFQYMSPEQIEGKELDARSDIFSFGAVLYEMLTGQRAFDGRTQASVIAAILEREPSPISSLQPMVPAVLDRIVKTCLTKDPDERWQSAHDLKAELEWMAHDNTGAPRTAILERPRWAMWLAALALCGAVLFAAGYFSRTISTPEAVRASLPPPPNAAFTISSSIAGSMAISPDGRQLAFTAQVKGGVPQLWVRPLDAITSRPLAGTENAFAPFWSPDNKWIAFFSGGKLKKVEASGGPVETLCDAPLGRGGTWNRDGLILFSPNISQPLYQVAAAGGAATPLTQMDASRQEVTHRWPEFLPDGKHYLFFVRAATPSSTGVYIGTLGSSEHHQVISSSMNAEYAPPGYLLFARGDVLVAQPFDVKRMQVTGTPVQVAQDVSVMPATNYVSFSVSQMGTLIYSSEAMEIGRQLYWYDRQGKQLSKLGTPEYGSWPQLSPDGKKLALRLWTQPAGNFEIWVYDLARGIHTRASFRGLTAFASVWSPDGTQLAYSHSAPQVSGDHMYLLNADGTGKEELLEQPFLESIANYPSSWSPDGQRLLFDHQDGSGKISIWVLPMSGDRKPSAFVDTQFKAEMGKFSPDGCWVAYVSNDSGRDEVYVVPFPGPGARVQVSTGGGSQPRWRSGGRELVYLSLETKMMAAEVTMSAGNFRVGTVQTLFLLSGLKGVPGYLYDMTADGQRFIAVQDLEHTSTIPLTVVVNWDAELRKK